MARKYLVGGHGVAVDTVGRDIDMAVAGVLDAVDKDQRIRCNCADCGGDACNVVGYACNG